MKIIVFPSRFGMSALGYLEGCRGQDLQLEAVAIPFPTPDSIIGTRSHPHAPKVLVEVAPSQTTEPMLYPDQNVVITSGCDDTTCSVTA
jgi:hypothetical protein